VDLVRVCLLRRFTDAVAVDGESFALRLELTIFHSSCWRPDRLGGVVCAGTSSGIVLLLGPSCWCRCCALLGVASVMFA
jgi:hypothetical protein